MQGVGHRAMAIERSGGDPTQHGDWHTSPQDISALGWTAILLLAWRRSNAKNIALVAGGVTFYVIMALAPGVASLISAYGLFANPDQTERQANAISGLLAPSARATIDHPLRMIVVTNPRTLGLGALLGIFIAVYTACRGMGGLIAALDIAYGETERRGVMRLTLTALGFVVGGVVALMLVGAMSIVAIDASLNPVLRWIMLIAGCLALLLFMAGLLALLYHFGPDRPAPRWRWASPGAGVASALWAIGTLLIYVYISNFGDYNRIYGSLSAVMVFLSWLWSSIYLVLLGAEMNAEAERQAGLSTRNTHSPGTPG
jgi:membrane protein